MESYGYYVFNVERTQLFACSILFQAFALTCKVCCCDNLLLTLVAYMQHT